MDRSIAGSEYNIGGILIKMGKYVQAEESLQIALDNFIMLEEKTGIIITNLRLAVARNRQGKPDAFNLAESALSMAKKINNPSLISRGYEVLSDISFYNKNYKKSHEYLLKHKTLQDSLFTADKERLLTEFEAKFQSERKDNEIKLLKGKSKIQQKNNILLISLITVLVGVIVLLIFLFRFKSTALNRQKKLINQGNIIHIQESKIIEKENLILKEQLESKNRELASKALEMIRFNDTISIVIEKLEGFNSTINKNQEESKHIKNVIYELENQTKQNIWNEFDKIFKNIHSGFYDKLLEICPDLTASEIKTAALLKLNLTTKEIAAITFKSEGGIKTTRYRLRKKLSLSSDEKLVPFLMKI
jgi:DNA-binding CsgD family transcriptional regulator